MQNEWPHLLADLRAKRDALTDVIDTIETHFSIPDEVAIVRSVSKGKRGRSGKRGRPLKRTNERTNERAKSAPARRTEPP